MHTAPGPSPNTKVTAGEPLECRLPVGIFSSLNGTCYLSVALAGVASRLELFLGGEPRPSVGAPRDSTCPVALDQPHPLSAGHMGPILSCGLAEDMI